MCKLLSCTPKELGGKREEDSQGISFLERHMIYRWKEEHKAREKYQKELERKSKGKRRR